MRWFKRASQPATVPSPRFPPDMLQRLDEFGRYEFDKLGSGIRGSVYERCLIPYVDIIEANEAEQEAFLRDLLTVVAEDRGGFATYGAAAIAWELFDENALRMPAALLLIDAGIEFKLARGLPPNMILTGYELRRYGDWFDQQDDAGDFDSRQYYQWLTRRRDDLG